MKDELIKQIAQEIATIGDEKLEISYSEKKTAERILNLIKNAGYVPKEKVCPNCGEGKVFDECTLKMVACPTCNGTGKVRDTYTVEEAGGVRKKWCAEVENNSHYVVIDLHNLQREMRISESWWQQFKERGIEQ